LLGAEELSFYEIRLSPSPFQEIKTVEDFDSGELFTIEDYSSRSHQGDASIYLLPTWEDLKYDDLVNKNKSSFAGVIKRNRELIRGPGYLTHIKGEPIIISKDSIPLYFEKAEQMCHELNLGHYKNLDEYLGVVRNRLIELWDPSIHGGKEKPDEFDFWRSVANVAFPVAANLGDKRVMLGSIIAGPFKDWDGIEPFDENVVREVLPYTRFVANAIVNATLVDKVQRESAARVAMAEKNVELERSLAAEKRLGALRRMTGQLGHSMNNKLDKIQKALRMIEGSLDAESSPGHLIIYDAVKQAPRGKQLMKEIYDALPIAMCNSEMLAEEVRRSRSSVATDHYQPKMGDLNETLKSYALSARLELDEQVGQLAFDPTLLYDALSNAIINSERAAERRKVAPEIVIRTKRLESLVEIDVQDNGVGLTPEELQKLRTPGEQYTSKGGGEGVVGFGVGTIRNIVETHGGTIDYESELNKGTTLKILLPYKS